MIKISAVLSIHNRGKLWSRALKGYLNQTMPREYWEIVLVDDMSTEDLSWTYKDHVGELNLRHVKMDHTRHPYWKERNPNGTVHAFENWYHTPAISINLGVALAKGSVICLCHPEILHAPMNLDRAWNQLAANKHFIFGKTYLGTQKMNLWLDRNDWSEMPWEMFLGSISHFDRLTSFASNELYWYTSFLPREAVVAARGVDFEYLKGAAAEDDDFRERVKQAGWTPVHSTSIQGFHQDHTDEGGHRRRDNAHWENGLKQNRATFFGRRDKTGFPTLINPDDWEGKGCLVEEVRYNLGSKTPEVIRA